MLDPEARWARYGKPDYAGLLTFAGVVYTEDPAERSAARARHPGRTSRPASMRSPICGSSTSAMRP
jgi:hypothetical protein